MEFRRIESFTNARYNDIAELDRLFTRLYEDNVLRKISDERFVVMSAGYEDEQKKLKVRQIVDLGSQGVILCTCCRTEVYYCGSCGHGAVAGLLSEKSGVPADLLLPYLSIYKDERAISHLFRVAGGLSSPVKGEDEILHQTVKAYKLAVSCGAAGYEVNRCFQDAIACWKKIRSETFISQIPLSTATIKAVAEFLHEREVPIPFIVDSTTATPYLVKHLELGADIVIHSTSKYVNGSGNAISGIIIDGGRFKWDSARYAGFEEYARYGKFAYLAKLRGSIWRNVGACLSPQNAFLNMIGLETLGLRMERLCDNALKLAEFLEARGGVEVNYPALPSSPYHELAVKQFGGRGGAILTVRVGSRERAFRLINSLRYALIATNIGDVRTLVIHPASTIYLHSTEEQMYKAGVFDDSIRISVGIEDICDLIGDFSQALGRTEE